MKTTGRCAMPCMASQVEELAVLADGRTGCELSRVRCLFAWNFIVTGSSVLPEAERRTSPYSTLYLRLAPTLPFENPTGGKLALHFKAVGHKQMLTLNLLTTTIVAPPSNTSKWQMGFNSTFKGLK